MLSQTAESTCVQVSSVAPGNTLPSFFWQAGSEEGGAYTRTDGYAGGLGTPTPFVPPDNCPDEIFANTMNDLRVPVLPWREQDTWGCERKPTDVPVIVMENEYLRAAVTPQWGGKIWSLYDKKNDKQMVFNNPAHQVSVSFVQLGDGNGASVIDPIRTRLVLTVLLRCDCMHSLTTLGTEKPGLLEARSGIGHLGLRPVSAVSHLHVANTCLAGTLVIQCLQNPPLGLQLLIQCETSFLPLTTRYCHSQHILLRILITGIDF